MYSKVNTALDVSTYPHSSWSHQVSKNHGIICLLWRNLYIYIDKHTFTASLSCSTRGGFDIVPWSLHLCGNPWFPNTWIATVLSPRASLRMLVHWGAVVYTFALVIYDDRYFELVVFFGDLYISLVDLWSMILYISWSISMYYVYIYMDLWWSMVFFLTFTWLRGVDGEYPEKSASCIQVWCIRGTGFRPRSRKSRGLGPVSGGVTGFTIVAR